ncbi:hypothetical protein [Streptomyces silvensis]|uniref:ATP-dependent DNA ligase family profile domain-containing protein n=1 Tax=Streptomyces silvensis TaxID=1765722 RepID=A0A0W7X3M1_9ACTN|nr:hypothetical protein [Streptomyces silvensis]KUF17384.1 hypothetical protein AT728_16415 [Streptomyces silvensis]
MSALWPLPLPVTVMRPAAVPAVPAGGGYQHSIKVDGFRAIAAASAEKLVLHSRSGRDLSAEIPEAAALLRDVLPAGTVLDGEVCAVQDGARMDFAGLLRTAAWRRAHGMAVVYVVLDALALGGQDVRPLPLRQRWTLLGEALQGTPLRPVMATEDREVALQWAADLAPAGVEGIVSRRWDSPYNPRLARAWVKWRRTDTVDAAVLAVLGPPRRPHAVRVLLEGVAVTTSPRLTSVQAAQVARAAAGHLGAVRTRADGTAEHSVTAGLVAEVRATSGRHRTVTFVRLRPPD